MESRKRNAFDEMQSHREQSASFKVSFRALRTSRTFYPSQISNQGRSDVYGRSIELFEDITRGYYILNASLSFDGHRKDTIPINYRLAPAVFSHAG